MSIRPVRLYGDPVPAIKLSGQILIAGSIKCEISAHDAANGGARIWTQSVPAPVTSPPAYSASNRLVAAGLQDGTVVLLNDQAGAEVWRFQTENAVVTAPFFLGQDQVFVGSTDDRLYALDWKTKPRRLERETRTSMFMTL